MSNRIDVYLDNDYKVALDLLVKTTGKNYSEIIRQCIDEYFLFGSYCDDIQTHFISRIISEQPQ